MNLQDIHFSNPFAAFLFFVIPGIFLLFVVLLRFKKIGFGKLVNAKNFSHLIASGSEWIFWSKCCGIMIVWMLVTFALMQPISYGRYVDGQLKEPVKKKKAHELILLADVSASMGVKDGRQAKTRLENLKDIAKEVVSQLEGQSVSVYTFTTVVAKKVPKTTDYLFTRFALNGLQINDAGAEGTNLQYVLEEIYKRVFSRKESVNKTLLLLTDGGDTEFETADESQKGSREAKLSGIIEEIKKNQGKVIIVGIGSKKGEVVPGITYEGKAVQSVLEELLLRNLAKAGGGYYYNGNELATLDIASKVSQLIKMQEKTEAKVEKPANLEYAHYFQIPLGLAIGILIGVIFFPDTVKKTVVISLFFLSTQVHGENFDETMRQAEGYFFVGEYVQSREVYYQLLQENLTAWERAIVLYNISTTFLAEGKSNEAISRMQKVPMMDFRSPYFAYMLNYNLLLAYIEKVESKNTNRKESLDSLQKATEILSLAKNEHCKWEKMEGKAQCDPVEELELLEEYLKQLKKVAESKEDKVSPPPPPQAEEGQEEEPSSPEPKDSGINEVLQLLLQMENEDAMKTVPTIPKHEQRPW